VLLLFLCGGFFGAVLVRGLLSQREYGCQQN
jgi:hypothetical protein